MSVPFYDIREIKSFKDMLVQNSALFPARNAFLVKNAEGGYDGITFPRLLKNVDYLGTGLLSRGLAGKTVAVIGKNSFEWCLTYLAVTCGGGVIVPVDKELPEDDIANILRTAEVSAVVFDEKEGEKALNVRDRIHGGVVYIGMRCEEDTDSVLSFPRLLEGGRELFKSGERGYADAQLDPKALSVLLFTSGTTGMAKGVMLSQYNICSDIMSLSGVVKITPDDLILSILPLHHTYECSLSFMMVIYSGGCVAFCEGLRYIMKNMQELQPTLFVTVPLMLEKFHLRILKKASESKVSRIALSFGKALSEATSAIGVNISDKIFAEITKNFGGRLRMIITGAAPIDPQIVKDFKAFGMPVYVGYGLTECSPLVIGNNDRLQLADSVGEPLPWVEAKILNPDASGVGEILIKGPMVMLGYYKDEKATAEVFTEDGWFRTGDLGSVDENGHYRIVGRIKNVIVTKNGKNIYPEEVEYYLNKSPLVAESLVFGSDDEDENGSVVEAKIFPDVEAIMEKFKNKAPTKEEVFKVISDVVREANKKLPKYKHVKRFDIRESEFIKTTTNKIKRHANITGEEKHDD